MWQISLSHRVASGYVYSSRHLADDAAVREFLAKTGPSKAASSEPRLTKLRAGRRRNFWLQNCIGLGPAAGVLEPLQAGEVDLLQKALELLVEMFPDETLNPVLRASYNRRMTAHHDKMRDVVLLHYLLSQRTEGEFWRDSRNVKMPEELLAVMNLHGENGVVEPDWKETFPETSFHHLFAAANRLPRRPQAAAAALEVAKIEDIFTKMRTKTKTGLPGCQAIEKSWTRYTNQQYDGHYSSPPLPFPGALDEAYRSTGSAAARCRPAKSRR